MSLYAYIQLNQQLIDGANISGTINNVNVHGTVTIDTSYSHSIIDPYYVKLKNDDNMHLYTIQYSDYYNHYIIVVVNESEKTDLNVNLQQNASTVPVKIPSKYLDINSLTSDILKEIKYQTKNFINNIQLNYREIASITIPEDPTTDTTATWITDSDNHITGFTIDKDSNGIAFSLQKVYALFSGISSNDGTSTKDLVLKLNNNTLDNFSLKGLVKNDRAEATLTIECLQGIGEVMITGAVMNVAPYGGQATPYMMTPNSNMHGRNNLIASSITKLTFTSDVAIKPGGKIKIFGINSL